MITPLPMRFSRSQKPPIAETAKCSRECRFWQQQPGWRSGTVRADRQANFVDDVGTGHVGRDLDAIDNGP